MNRIYVGLAAVAWLATSDVRLPEMTFVVQAPSIVAQAPAAYLADDPADSLYRLAREALNGGKYRRAADSFAELTRRYPKSGYAADALYWEAFALYRLGGDDDLRKAQQRLELQKRNFPKAGTAGDAATLATRIRGELARRGDSNSAESLLTTATSAGSSSGGTNVSAGTGSSTSSRNGLTVAGGDEGDDACDDDSDIKLAALNGLLQMDAERAMPLLTRVLARRDAGSICLRRKAVFLVAQKHTDGAADVLLGAARNDPDGEVRGQAIFWLSQVHSPRAVAALDSIARNSTDEELQGKAVFALAQQDDPAAGKALRDLAERKGTPLAIREKAIFWLGQSRTGGSEYLRGLYERLDDDELKEKVIFGVSQQRSPENSRWLMDIVRSPKSSIELRKKALFWSGQSGATAADLGAIYASLTDEELKEQAIFALAQTRDSGGVDRLIEIARKDPNTEMRKKALFWLSQSKDPRAASVIEQILND
jgi:HEAT repeat protein